MAVSSQCLRKKDMPNNLSAVNIIMAGLSILQNTAYNMEQRMVLLGLFLDRAEDCLGDAQAASDLIEYCNSADLKQEISKFIKS